MQGNAAPILDADILEAVEQRVELGKGAGQVSDRYNSSREPPLARDRAPSWLLAWQDEPQDLRTRARDLGADHERAVHLEGGQWEGRLRNQIIDWVRARRCGGA
jgi:hypothetical protein